MYFRSKRFVLFICWFCLLALCGQGCRYTRREATVAIPPEQVLHKLKLQPEILMPVDSLHPVYKGLEANLNVFYKSRDHKPVWFRYNTLSGSGDSLVTFIRNIRYYGLLPSSYHWDEITNLLKVEASGVPRLDALLTDAFMSITKDVAYGRLRRRNAETDSIATQLLNGVALNGDPVRALNRIEPRLQGYHDLKRGLKVMLDSLSAIEDPGLEISSEISTSFVSRLEAIEINLERWRSETRPWGSRYIFVNIPAFMMYVVFDGVVVMQSRVIVGKPETPTPQLTGILDYVVTYPYWHVPRKIAMEEYLPIIQRDVSFLTRNRFDVLDQRGALLNPDSVAWTTFSRNYFPVSLRQREGTENSMGIIKFGFDNPYAVYLHDTNAKRLFNSSIRAFSHGCIRMEKAVELSHYLLTGDIAGRSKLIDRNLNEKLRQTITLSVPIPIYIRYFSAEFTDGGFTYHNDIYGRDSYLAERFYGVNISDGL